MERVQDYPEDYQDYFLHEYESPEAYFDHMRRDGSWADAAIIRATVDALDVEIQFISDESEYSPILTTSSGNPTETIFLGQIMETHFTATAVRSEPQQVLYGGITTDGVQLLHSDKFDVPMTWLLNILSAHQQLREKTVQEIPEMGRILSKFKHCNSADMKKQWLQTVRRNQYPVTTKQISLKDISSIEVLKLSTPHEFECTKTYK